MKVVIAYSISQAELDIISSATKERGEIDFEPYYDIEYNDNNPLDSYESMASSLRSAGYDCYTLNIFDDYNIFLEDYASNKPDVVFNLVEMFRNRPDLEMSFACFLELMKIPYTGAPPLALGTCQKKTLTKKILCSLGLRTPDFFIVSSICELDNLNLRYPLIVKPSQEDASIGIENASVVFDFRQLHMRTEYMLEKFRQDILIEEYIEGREFNLSVIGGNPVHALPVSEVDFSRMPSDLHKIVSYQAKWDPFNPAFHSTVPVCPAQLDEEITKKAKELAVRAFKGLGCRDYARVDMRMDNNNNLYILEVNPNPDLTEGAGFMRSSLAAGYSFKRSLKRIVDMAYLRSTAIVS